MNAIDQAITRLSAMARLVSIQAMGLNAEKKKGWDDLRDELERAATMIHTLNGINDQLELENASLKKQLRQAHKQLLHA